MKNLKNLKNKIRSMFAAAVSILMISSVCAPAMAADVQNDTISLSYPVENAEFSLYRAADIVGTDWVLTGEFKDKSVNLKELDGEGWREAAETLDNYVKADGIAPMSTKTTNADKQIVWEGLEPGLYLVTGKPMKVGKTTYTPAPALVGVLYTSPEGVVPVAPKYDEETEPDTVEHRVVKVWSDGNSADHPGIRVNLMQDGTVINTVMLRDTNNWTYKWSGLEAGHTYVAVEASTVEGYTSSSSTTGDTTTITNTKQENPQPERTSHTVRKVWRGNGEHPSSVLVMLMRDGSRLGNTVELNASNNWTHTWSNLETGHTYTAVETAVPDGYTMSAQSNNGNTTITNTKQEEPQPETTKHRVEKVWRGDSASDRPASIEVQLTKDGDKVGNTVALNAGNNWQHEWTNLETGHVYGAVEVNVPDGYTMTSSTGNGATTITNTKKEEPKPETTEHGVTKVWDDGDAADRPESITVDFMKDGEKVESVTLNEDNEWSYKWTGLEKGHNYTAVETNVPDGYSMTTSTNNGVTTITNSKPHEEDTEHTVIKKWVGDSEQDRPESIMVDLIVDDTDVVDTVELNADNNWTYTWTGLETGHTWEAFEQNAPEGYKSTSTVTGSVTTITNTMKEEPDEDETDHTVIKKWVDGNSSNRPESITVVLLHDGDEYDEVELSADNNWTYTWTGLKPADGDWFAVEDVIPDGYDSKEEVTGKVTTITNTLKEEDDKEDIKVVKVWKNAAGKTNPESITAVLKRDGATYDEIKLSEANSWQHTWTGLDKGPVWTISEKEVPTGYNHTVTREGNVFTITNTDSSLSGDGDDNKDPNDSDNNNPPGGGDDNNNPPGDSGNNNGNGGNGGNGSNNYGSNNGNGSNGGGGYSNGGSSGGSSSGGSYSKLPQTGQLWWPVAAMAVGGLLMFSLGWVRRQKNK